VSVPIWQPLDEAVGPHPHGRSPGRLRSHWGVKRQIVHEIPHEQEEILLHKADEGAQVRGGQVSDVDAVHENAAAGWVVEAKQQIDDGCLPCSGVPHQGHRPAGRGSKGHIAQYPGAAVSVAEPDPLEAHLTPGRASQQHRPGRLLHHDRLIQQPEHPLR
jgi:hypothetical protein